MIRAGVLLPLIVLAGCVRRDGRNSDCRWPIERNALVRGETGFERHLSHDTEFAEELAIRYMEARTGPRDMQAAARAKNECMDALLSEIGKAHGISAQEAFRFFGKRDPIADLVLHLPFLLLYCLGADWMVRRLLANYPIPLVALAALVFGAAGLVIGEQWTVASEAARVGNWHLSNRALRLPIAQNRGLVYALGVALFLAIAANRYRLRSPNR